MDPKDAEIWLALQRPGSSLRKVACTYCNSRERKFVDAVRRARDRIEKQIPGLLLRESANTAICSCGATFQMDTAQLALNALREHQHGVVHPPADPDVKAMWVRDGKTAAVEPSPPAATTAPMSVVCFACRAQIQAATPELAQQTLEDHWTEFHLNWPLKPVLLLA